MSTRIMIAAASTLTLLGCDSTSVPASGVAASPARSAEATVANRGKSETAPPAVADWDARACGDDMPTDERLQRHPRLMKRSPDELRAVFGPPNKTDEFRMGEARGTFGSGLGSLLPGGEAANAGRMAREETWTKSGCNLTVFFADLDGRWSAIDAFEWTVGSEF